MIDVAFADVTLGRQRAPDLARDLDAMVGMINEREDDKH